MFETIHDVPTVLSHTDAGPHNTVWDGTNAVPVDFEFASLAPEDLDLECVLRTVALQTGPSPATTLLEHATDLMARPGAKARLWGYAVLRDMWGLRGWLRYANGGGDLSGWGAETHDIHTWGPWLHLRGHVDRTSWLGNLLR
jgi:hypothetical protein